MRVFLEALASWKERLNRSKEVCVHLSNKKGMQERGLDVPDFSGGPKSLNLDF